MAEYRNSIRSRKLIRDAFIELIYEKGDINKITVKEIVERADISKSTFYGHYDDIYGVLEEFENELIQTISTTIDDYFKNTEAGFTPYIKQLLNLLKENEDLYKKLFHAKADDTFIDKLKKLIQKEFRKYSNYFHNLSKEKSEFFLSFTTNGLTYMVLDYFKNDSSLSLDQIADTLNEMLDMTVETLKERKIVD